MSNFSPTDLNILHQNNEVKQWDFSEILLISFNNALINLKTKQLSKMVIKIIIYQKCRHPLLVDMMSFVNDSLFHYSKNICYKT